MTERASTLARCRGTQATAIAALEARRNEEETLAAGSLAGERRAALARVAMVAMSAVSIEIAPRLLGETPPTSLGRQLAGMSYSLYAIAMVAGLARARPDARRARWRPFINTAIETTWAACGERFAGERLEPAAIRGRVAPVGLYALAPPT